MTDIDADLVRSLVAAQFPEWRALTVEFVPQGWDHRTFRLGDELVARLPSAAEYVPQGEKERRWLPVLAQQVSLPIPTPVAVGAPGSGYPFPWSVYRWIGGDVLDTDSVIRNPDVAERLGGFLLSLQTADASGAPGPGAHSAYRGSPPIIWSDDVARCLPLVDPAQRSRLEMLWSEACESVPTAPPVWFHGDVAAGNLVFRGGELAAVLDFGCSGVGDPACDVAAAWMLFAGDARERFLHVLSPDPGLRARARGWALWKALLFLEEGGDRASVGQRILDGL